MRFSGMCSPTKSIRHFWFFLPLPETLTQVPTRPAAANPKVETGVAGLKKDNMEECTAMISDKQYPAMPVEVGNRELSKVLVV